MTKRRIQKEQSEEVERIASRKIFTASLFAAQREDVEAKKGNPKKIMLLFLPVKHEDGEADMTKRRIQRIAS